MKFEQWNRQELQCALEKRGWRKDCDAPQSVAGQQHAWHVPSNVRGFEPDRFTLRNAARHSGLVK